MMNRKKYEQLSESMQSQDMMKEEEIQSDEQIYEQEIQNLKRENSDEDDEFYSLEGDMDSNYKDEKRSQNDRDEGSSRQNLKKQLQNKLNDQKRQRQERRDIRKKNMEQFVGLFQKQIKIKQIASKMNISLGNAYYLCRIYQKKLKGAENQKRKLNQKPIETKKCQLKEIRKDRHLTPEETTQLISIIQNKTMTIMQISQKLKKLVTFTVTHQSEERKVDEEGYRVQDEFNESEQEKIKLRRDINNEQQKKLDQLKEVRLKGVKEIIEKKPQSTVNEVHRILKSQYGLSCTRTTVAKLIKVINFSTRGLLALPLEAHHDKAIQQRLAFVRKIDKLKNEDVIYLDQIGFTLSLVDIFGLIPRLQIAFQACQGAEEESINLLIALCSDKIACELIVEGQLNQKSIIGFIGQLKNCHLRGTGTKTIVVDKSKYFGNQKVMDAIKVNGFNCLIVPPGFPQLNPTQEIFSRLRGKLIRKLPRTSKDMRQLLEKQLKKVFTDAFGRNYSAFGKLREFIRKVIIKYPYENEQPNN